MVVNEEMSLQKEGASFGKSQLLNGANFGNQNKNKKKAGKFNHLN